MEEKELIIKFLQLDERELLRQRDDIDLVLRHVQDRLAAIQEQDIVSTDTPPMKRKAVREIDLCRELFRDIQKGSTNKNKTLKYVNPPKYSEQLLDFFKQNPNRAFTQADIADHFYPLWHKFATGKTTCTSRIGALLYGLRKHPDIKVTKTSDKRFAMTYVC
jgi:hypothetical protein